MGTLDPLRLTAREAKRLLVDGAVSAAEMGALQLFRPQAFCPLRSSQIQYCLPLDELRK